MPGFITLERCDGPACPKCGCRETHQYRGRRRWGGGEYVQYVCGHCGKVFYPEPRWKRAPPEDESSGNGAVDVAPVAEPEARPDGAVIYRPLVCPVCGSADTKIERTMPQKESIPRVRYHKCKVCGGKFKSVESPPSS